VGGAELHELVIMMANQEELDELLVTVAFLADVQRVVLMGGWSSGGTWASAAGLMGVLAFRASVLGVLFFVLAGAGRSGLAVKCCVWTIMCRTQ
jgi:hypothetical protein